MTETEHGLRDRVAFLSGSALPATHRPRTARLRPAPPSEAPVGPADPVMAVVSDFTWERPVVVAEDRPIDEALREMMEADVHALLAMRDDVVTGLITSFDIEGERPLHFLRASGLIARSRIEVGHIMTPWERVPTLDWQALRAARVQTAVDFFRASTATHAVIIEHGEQGGTFVRGLISRMRLERQLRRSTR